MSLQRGQPLNKKLFASPFPTVRAKAELALKGPRWALSDLDLTEQTAWWRSFLGFYVRLLHCVEFPRTHARKMGGTLGGGNPSRLTTQPYPAKPPSLELSLVSREPGRGSAAGAALHAA